MKKISNWYHAVTSRIGLFNPQSAIRSSQFHV